MVDDIAPLTFQCRMQNCDELVEYREMRVPGALKHVASPEPRTRVVYLRCANGHVHPYKITI